MTLTKTLPRLKLSKPTPLPDLILLTDPRLVPDPVAVASGLPVGSAVVLRHYGAANRLDVGRRLARLCRRRRLIFLVADDARLAARLHADGLHLPEFRVRNGPRRWRLLRHANWLVTAAAHSKEAIVAAARQGCDAVLVSPVFPTASHPLARPLGVVRFAGLAAEAGGLDVYALGGITTSTAKRLSGTRLSGVAGISVFQPTQQSLMPVPEVPR